MIFSIIDKGGTFQDPFLGLVDSPFTVDFTDSVEELGLG